MGKFILTAALKDTALHKDAEDAESLQQKSTETFDGSVIQPIPVISASQLRLIK